MPHPHLTTPVVSYRSLLSRYLAPQRGSVLLMSVLLLASILFQLGAPRVAAAFVDAVGNGADEGALQRLALLFLGVALAQQGLYVLAEYASERVAWVATNALRVDLTAHLLHLDPGFHTDRTPGELIERVDGDVGALASFFSSFAVKLVGSGLLLSGVLVGLAQVDWRLGVAFAAFTVGALALLGWVRRFGTPYWRDDRAHSARFYGYVGEVLTATEDLRSCGAVLYALRRFLTQVQGWWPVKRKANIWGQAVMMAAIVAFAVADGLAYGVGGSLYRVGGITLGTVYLILAYVTMLAAPIETIRSQLQDLQRADAAIGRVREFLSIRSKLVDGAGVLPDGPLAVELQGVRFAYRNAAAAHGDEEPTAVLDDVSIRLEAGRVLGLLGRTGSGKSTLARLLFRLYDPQVGAVRLGGTDVTRLRLSNLRARIGLVTQDVQIFAASVRDNLTFFDASVSDEQLVDLIETLGLKPWVDRLPRGLQTEISAATLSAGEAQLVAFARVFLKNPGLIILDEASSRLDPATEAMLGIALERLLQDRTAIIIAHRLATVERADEILILDAARVVEHGPRVLLASDPGSAYARLRQGNRQEVLA